MISDDLLEYAEFYSTQELTILEKLSRETHLTQVYPRMMAGTMQGTFLRLIGEMMKPRRILEIGTFTGYSALCFAASLPESGLLHTIEVNPEQEEVIRRYIQESGLGKKIILHIGDAKTVIPSLEEIWDLVYIDADKPNYLAYYHLIFEHVRPGGFILADNTLWDGKVLNERSGMDKDTLGIEEFNDFIHHDARVDNLLLPFRDGIMMIRKH